MDVEAPAEDDDLDDADEEVIAEASEEEHSPEAETVRVKKALELPTREEMSKHDATHCPYRSWSEVCFAVSGKEDAHAKTASLDV